MPAESRSIAVGEDGVAELRLEGHGRAISALRSPLAESLDWMVAAVERTPGVRGVLLHIDGRSEPPAGEPPHTRRGAEAECRAEQAAVSRLAESRVPFVACLSGPVHGVAFEIALACRARLALADTGASVALSDLEVGLAPRLGGLRRIAELASLGTALELGMHGTVLEASAAAAAGLVDALVPVARARRAATELASEPPRSDLARPGILDRIAARDREALALARRELTSGPDVGYPACIAVLEVLESIADDRSRSTAPLEARYFGELLFSSAAQKLRALREAARPSAPARAAETRASALTERLLRMGISYAREASAGAAPHRAFVRRIFDPLDREARSLVLEGVDPRRVEAALADWGFLELPSLGSAATSNRPMACELIQMRCVLPLVVEALRALEQGSVPDPATGDIAAVFLGGFPPFRGGVFRYVDDIGARELSQRLDAFRREHGSRYEPPPQLRRLAEQDGRIHPTISERSALESW